MCIDVMLIKLEFTDYQSRIITYQILFMTDIFNNYLFGQQHCSCKKNAIFIHC